MRRNREFALGAALAGSLLVAMPFLDLLVGGESAAAVRVLIGSCGLALLAVSAALHAGKEEA